MKRTLVVILLVAIPASGASRLPVREKHGMVVSVTEASTRAGVDVLKRGGNAVDAAVAVALALAVAWPSAGNLGGGGFMIIRKADGNTEVIDYRERAPLEASRDMYLDTKGEILKGSSTEGHKAVAVPGTVAGLALAHKRHGKLTWSELVEPARKLVADGVLINQYLERSLRSDGAKKKLQPFAESYRIFQRNGDYYRAGERLVQPELAATLARIKKDPRDFYEGVTAQRLVAEMRLRGGIISLDDLKEYEPTIREPLHGWYRGYEIITMPPSSSGGIAIIEMLNMLESHDLKSMGWHSAQYVHVVVEVMRRAFADRAQYLGDTDFVKVPVTGLISKEYARERNSTIDPSVASVSLDLMAGDPAPYESTETTHFTIIDAAGTVVTNTYTLNDSFGSGVTAKGTGILLNNEMDDFTSKPGVANLYGLIQGEANAIAPRKRPLSSMTPTMVLKDGKFFFALGSPGGPTIINTVLQIILNVIDFDMTIQEAIDLPRFHHQWLPDELHWEEREFSKETRQAIEALGHRFREKPGFSDSSELGDVQGVMVDSENGDRLGASDPRRGGVAAGY